MQISRTSDLWWKNAVFYCLDVETFQDGNGDGIGDFQGLTHRLDYLASLGVTCIWLMPFYPTPNLDDGYDITDYYTTDPRLGSLGDFVAFMRTAHDRGLRVIADLVVNHTSSEHPWFLSARSDPKSPFRNWYVWSKEIPEDWKTSLIFPDKETSNWTWDEAANAYYLHRFYRHQPDLNIGNPEVREEICKIVGFWLELGLDGFRVDAVPFLLETEGTSAARDFMPHQWLRELRGFISRRRGDAMLLGEVNLSYEDTRRFFGDEGDELHMCLNFNLNQALALSLVRKDSGPLVHGLTALPSLPEEAAWANFVRNHDEWSLDKLTEAERQEVFRAFGADPDMQLFGRGLRRRLPTMLNGDQGRIRATYGAIFSFPGAPVLFYGEEIGMAENLAIPGRLSVRAPMQWSDDPNGGFSDASPEQLRRPMVEGRKWGPKAINVAGQMRDSQSLFNWMEHLIRQRRETPEIAFGTLTVLPVTHAGLVALRYDWQACSVVVFQNLGPDAIELSVPLSLSAKNSKIVDIFGAGRFALAEDGSLSVALEPFATRWLRFKPVPGKSA